MPTDSVPIGTTNAQTVADPGAVVKLFSALAVATEATVWTPAAGKSYRLTGFDLAGSVAGEYVFRDALAGTVIYRTYLAANTPRAIALPGSGLFGGAVNRVLTAQGPATATLTGALYGTEE